MNKDIKYLVERLFDDESDLLDSDELTLDELNIADNLNEYVDLGLTSGTLWCSHNAGTKTYKESGDYLNWNEAYRLYHKNLPTPELFNELYAECEWEWNYDLNGYKIIGKHNNYIFLPAAGIKYKDIPVINNFLGSYWSSDLHTSYNAYVLEFTELDINRTVCQCSFNLPVRLCKK